MTPRRERWSAGPVAAAQAGPARSESTGQARMLALHERHRGDGSWRDRET
ncbi:hypothetical protein MXD59_15115 [Frankia sp. Ag45/Mut15]|uniref:Uncharacterized protein n=1 Tax=Frankia umida TaxID=573489 RepID=A0ABT0JZX8_9ACTN|nr:hypothetical protein [Frankia umida]MCK9877087.1 hypothetical protein [Frankia umida]